MADSTGAGCPVSRREFLIQIAGSAGALAGLAGCASVPVFPAIASQGRIVLERALVQEAMQQMGVVRISNDGYGTVLLFRTGPETYRALNAKCTHLGCQVRPAGGHLSCPCHGSSFDLDGSVVRGPAQRPLRRYQVEVNYESIEILL